MKKLRKSFKWCWLLNKRLLKKYSFVFLLCMVPILIAGMYMISKEESGVLHIVLYSEKDNSTVVDSMIEKLMACESILKFDVADSHKEAYHAVASGQADAAWIWEQDFEENLRDCMEHKKCITIVEREENVSLQLAREKLYGVLYPSISYSLYRKFIVDEFLDGKEGNEKELQEDYLAENVEDSIFTFAFVDKTQMEDINYLTAPLRGILSILLVLVGIAMAMFYQRDEQMGTFSFMAGRKKMWFSYGYHFIGVIDCGLVIYVAYFCCDMATGVFYEMWLMLLYAAVVAGFSNFVGAICNGIKMTAAILPVLITAMFLLCPVFFSLNELKGISCLFPPYYYLRAVHDNNYVNYMMLYGIIVSLAGIIIRGIRQR